MKALYFAWVRERVGRAEEELEPPPTVKTVGDLVAWLRDAARATRLPSTNPLLFAPRSIGFTSRSDASIAGAKEVAFFPPMTGG